MISYKTNLLILVFLISAVNIVFPQSDSTCEMSEFNKEFVKEAIDDWEILSKDILQVKQDSLPWIFLYDTSCVYHISPDTSKLIYVKRYNLDLSFFNKPVAIYSKKHFGKILLPNKEVLSVKPVAFTSLYDNDRKTFFAVALLDVWLQNPKAADMKNLKEIFLGVINHELVHTLNLVKVNDKINKLKEKYNLPEDINDDIIENTFKIYPEFKNNYEAVSDSFYKAVEIKDKDKKIKIIKEALTRIEKRKARYYQERFEGYGELEDLFLNMEGVAVWAAYKLLELKSSNVISTGKIERSKNSWSQDRGLALFLLIDELVPNWRNRVLGSELASPYLLLDEVVKNNN